MIKQYRVKTYSADTQVALNDSFNGQCVLNITKFRDNHITSHQEVYLDREHLKQILEDMESEAEND